MIAICNADAPLVLGRKFAKEKFRYASSFVLSSTFCSCVENTANHDVKGGDAKTPHKTMIVTRQIDATTAIPFRSSAEPLTCHLATRLGIAIVYFRPTFITVT